MKKWLLDIRDILMDILETVVNEFWTQLKKDISLPKVIFGLLILIIAGGMILSNMLSDQNGQPVQKQENVKSNAGSPSDTAINSDAITLEDKAEALDQAHQFIQQYSTYQPGEKLADKIRPYVTQAFYLNQKQADQQARPTFDVYMSKVISIEKGFIEPMNSDLYWTGNVVVETTNKAGQKQRQTMLYAVMLTREEGWKVKEVEVLDSPTNSPNSTSQ